MKGSYNIVYIDESKKAQGDLSYKLEEEFQNDDVNIKVKSIDIRQSMSCEELMSEVVSCDADLLIIDFKLSESGELNFNGDEVEAALDAISPAFPRIIFTNDPDDAKNHIDNRRMVFSKRVLNSTNDLEEFGNDLIGLIKSHKKKIESRREHIRQLIDKGEREGLSVKERDLLQDIQNSLYDLYLDKEKEAPGELVSNENLDLLSKARAEAEEYIKQLVEESQ